MIHVYPYTNLLDWQSQPLPDSFTLQDHIFGHSPDMTNSVLDHLNTVAGKQGKKLQLNYHSILDHTVTSHYPNLQINFDAEFQNRVNLAKFADYNVHPYINFKNFVCSFNGSPHVSRRLLVSIIKKLGWFTPEYCSKNFQFTLNNIDRHLRDVLSSDRHRFYIKFFLTSDEFCQQKYSFGHVRFDHANNIYNLESKLTESFLHIVSETMATSYYPFVTEKFLYSVITRGLFLAYAQPGWHTHLEKYYGFKRYTKLFDYRFDLIQNPVERLVELMSMISKFSVLSVHDWHDLYLIEQDTIEYNYNHYYSKDYLKCLEKHAV
jgi:hypothetical protein